MDNGLARTLVPRLTRIVSKQLQSIQTLISDVRWNNQLDSGTIYKLLKARELSHPSPQANESLKKRKRQAMRRSVFLFSCFRSMSDMWAMGHPEMY
jgi:hypothetical protein